MLRHHRCKLAKLPGESIMHLPVRCIFVGGTPRLLLLLCLSVSHSYHVQQASPSQGNGEGFIERITSSRFRTGVRSKQNLLGWTLPNPALEDLA